MVDVRPYVIIPLFLELSAHIFAEDVVAEELHVVVFEFSVDGCGEGDGGVGGECALGWLELNQFFDIVFADLFWSKEVRHLLST